MNDQDKKSFFDAMHQPVANAVIELHKLLDVFEDSHMRQYAKQKVDEAYLWATQIFQRELMKEAERLAAEAMKNDCVPDVNILDDQGNEIVDLVH